jgi:hypothetical protein
MLLLPDFDSPAIQFLDEVSFELRLGAYLPNIDPAHFSVEAEKPINPADYFVTSGDAIHKCQQLERDLWSLAHTLRRARRRRTPARYLAYERAIWSCANRVRSLQRDLLRIRGTNCFLETEWTDRKLIVRIKNPRTKRRSS